MKLSRAFFDDIRKLVVSARTTVARGVDLVQVHTNFEIGRRIIEQEQKGQGRAAYGEEAIAALAGRLTAEFGSGFSPRNLAYMRTFFLLYQIRSPILQSAIAKSAGPKNLQSLTAKSPSPRKARPALARSAISPRLSGNLRADAIPSRPFTLSWTHYIFLLGIKNPDERSFYEIEATAGNWTVREVRSNGNPGRVPKPSRDGPPPAEPAGSPRDRQPTQLPREPLVLGFLGLDERARYSESDLEGAMIGQIGIGRVGAPGRRGDLRSPLQKTQCGRDAREYQLYLPSKKELQDKLQEWAAEAEGG